MNSAKKEFKKVFKLIKSFPEVKIVKAFFDKSGKKKSYIASAGHDMPRELKDKIASEIPGWDVLELDTIQPRFQEQDNILRP